MNEKMKTVVVLSGGLDSTCMLYKIMKDYGHEVEAISFNYGQKHKKELEMAKQTCEVLEIKHTIVDVTFLKELLNKSSLLGEQEIPEGHYADDNMKSTVVANRNMIMASIAIGYAINIDADAIALGIHKGDHTIYPDCRPEFADALSNIAAVCDYKVIKVLTPYLSCDKIDIVQDGIQNGVDFSKT